MANDTDLRTSLVKILDTNIRRGKLAASLGGLLALSDEQMEVIMDPIFALTEFVGGRKLNEGTEEHLRHVMSLLTSMTNMVKGGVLSSRTLEVFINLQRDQQRAVNYLPEPFRGPQQVGAIILMAKVRCARLEIDLPEIAIGWGEKLGKPVALDGEFPGKHPCMMPVTFAADNGMNRIIENPQEYFGIHPALRSGCSTAPLVASCERWPMENSFAFSPLPTWAADDSGKKFWLENHTWPEQQDELRRLQRQYPNFTVRFARLHELVFIDLCWRLATLCSPMHIFSFRCENPADGKNCLTYGGVDQYGGEIETERDSARLEHGVLPLFFVKGEKKKK